MFLLWALGPCTDYDVTTRSDSRIHKIKALAKKQNTPKTLPYVIARVGLKRATGCKLKADCE